MSAQPASFYGEYPFDWIERYHPGELPEVISPALLGSVATCRPNASVLDAGCGAGRVLAYLAHRKIRCIGVDSSVQSMRLLLYDAHPRENMHSFVMQKR